MSTDFGKQVAAFANKAKQRQEAIFRTSTQRVNEIANTPIAQGGRMPVDTGFLRNSNVAAIGSIPTTSSSPPVLVYATMKIGDTVWTGWTAAHARRQEYGFHGPDSLGRVYSQNGKGFMRGATQQWQQIVNAVTREVEIRIK